MRIRNFVLTTGEVNNNPEKSISIPSGTGKRLTLDASMGTMDLANARIIIGDGSSTRTLTYVYTVTNDSHLPASSGGTPLDSNLMEGRIVKAIEGTSGSTLDVTTTSSISQASDGVDVLIEPTTANTVTVTLAQNGASTDPATMINITAVGLGKRLTMTSTNASNRMSLNGATMTVSDGNGNSRIIRFSNSFTNDLDISTIDGSSDDVENHYVRAINGTTGGSINVTATSTVDDALNSTIDITHNSGGNVTVTLDQNGAMSNPSGLITISDISGTSTEVLVAQEVVTGSVAQSRLTNTPYYGKITLRNGRHSPGSLAAYNVTIGENDITYSNDSFHITGSLSGGSDPSHTEAKRVSGDFIIVAEGR